MYLNYIRLIKELYDLNEETGKKYEYTIRVMLDECVYHFMDSHKIPYEKQGEFLSAMFYDYPKVVSDYKTKKFTEQEKSHNKANN